MSFIIGRARRGTVWVSAFILNSRVMLMAMMDISVSSDMHVQEQAETPQPPFHFPIQNKGAVLRRVLSNTRREKRHLHLPHTFDPTTPIH
jgi:hypothetical protein